MILFLVLISNACSGICWSNEKNNLKWAWSVSLLGLQVKQLENGIFISQSKYAKHLVKKFRLDLAKHIRTPMSTNLRLTKDDSGSDVDPCLYRSMIGSVLYLTGCRVNIYF